METIRFEREDAKRLDWLLRNTNKLKDIVMAMEKGTSYVNRSEPLIKNENKEEDLTPEKETIDESIFYVFRPETCPKGLMEDYKLSPYGTLNPLYSITLGHFDSYAIENQHKQLTIVGNSGQIKDIQSYLKLLEPLTKFKDNPKSLEEFTRNMNRIFYWYIRNQKKMVSLYIVDKGVKQLTQETIKDYKRRVLRRNESNTGYVMDLIGYPHWLSKIMIEVSEMTRIINDSSIAEKLLYYKTFKYMKLYRDTFSY